jgi:hypothetical protein
LSFESLFTLKIFVPTRMGDFINGVYVCLPLIGGKNPSIGDLNREHVCLLGCTFLLTIAIPEGHGTLVACCLTVGKCTILEVIQAAYGKLFLG